ncbi:MAG: transcription termination factor NusA [Bdellovibrionales bacterium]|nr:transcription termination factor NusA [Bdellovibrionales bacterium]
MAFTELTRVIDALGKDRGIGREVVIEALEQAMLMAARKKLGPTAELEAHWNEELGEVEIFQFKKVVESDDKIADDDREIALDEARKLDEDAKLGDELGIRMEGVTFGRIDAQTARQIIIQKVRDAERDIIYKEFIGRKGQIISGIARRLERGNLMVDLGRTEAVLPRSGIIPTESYKPGDRVQALLQEVGESTRGPQLVLSRTSPQYLIKLFEMEVPEVSEGVVEIRLCVREPGERAKIAVYSNDRDVDPVGACVGMRGIRVQNVVQELRGEKIDIIPWNEDVTVFIRSALAPAEISMVRVIPATHTLEIVVEDDQLSLAIGRKGQNVRLASQLVGWKVDILSKSKLETRTKAAIANLKNIDGLNDTLAQSIYQCGFLNVLDLSRQPVETLARIPGFDNEGAATELKRKAEATVQKIGIEAASGKLPDPIPVPAAAPETVTTGVVSDNGENG